MGLYPQPFLSRMKPSIEYMLKKVFIVQSAPAAAAPEKVEEGKANER
jgi:hypothetical protein